jgi:protein TonB
MTAATFNPGRSPALPRRAIALSLAVHAAAFVLLPGLAREAKQMDLPPLIATLRMLPASQPAAETPLPAKVGEARPAPRQPLPQVTRTEERTTAPAPVPATPRNEAPATASLPAFSLEKAAREEAPSAPAAKAAPPPAVPETLVLDDYGRALSELLARQQQYPRLAALRGWEGEVKLRLKVARKGSLVAVQVVHSSGHEVLDQHALQLVQGAALPAPPDALGDREIQVVVPIHYKLQRPT